MLENFENKKLRNKSFSNAATNKSTLSLHISAYENSIESTAALGLDLFNDKISKRKPFIVSSLTVQNPFEFPRQQENEPSRSSVMQFSSSQRLRNPNEATNHIIQSSTSQQPTQYPYPQHQQNFHMLPPPPDYFPEIFERLNQLQIRQTEQDAKIDAMMESNQRLQSQNEQLVNLLTSGGANVNANFVFDPRNYQNRSLFDFTVKFHDSPEEAVNLHDIASALGVWRRTANDTFPGDLFRAIVKSIYEDQLSEYTAAQSRRGGLISIYDLKEAIKTLVLHGYTTPSTSEAETIILTHWIDENIEKVSKNLFNNSRRPSRSKNATPTRKSKPKRLRVESSGGESEDEE
uniref:Uncharacterized protein n=1 Tax=Panagrolaimus davidi TaxID=227884 RepID=A0A914QSY7_9BILA